MSTKKSADTSFRDLVARLNAMSNMTPDEERAELMEAANKAPKVLDDKDISLADIAKLAGIKEYVEPAPVSADQTCIDFGAAASACAWCACACECLCT